MIAMTTSNSTSVKPDRSGFRFDVDNMIEDSKFELKTKLKRYETAIHVPENQKTDEQRNWIFVLKHKVEKRPRADWIGKPIRRADPY